MPLGFGCVIGFSRVLAQQALPLATLLLPAKYTGSHPRLASACSVPLLTANPASAAAACCSVPHGKAQEAGGFAAAPACSWLIGSDLTAHRIRNPPPHPPTQGPPGAAGDYVRQPQLRPGLACGPAAGKHPRTHVLVSVPRRSRRQAPLAPGLSRRHVLVSAPAVAAAAEPALYDTY